MSNRLSFVKVFNYRFRKIQKICNPSLCHSWVLDHYQIDTCVLMPYYVIFDYLITISTLFKQHLYWKRFCPRLFDLYKRFITVFVITISGFHCNRLKYIQYNVSFNFVAILPSPDHSLQPGFNPNIAKIFG